MLEEEEIFQCFHYNCSPVYYDNTLMIVFVGVIQQATIISAMRRLEQLVAVNNRQCILFRPRVPSDQYYIGIENQNGCWSYVGVI